MKLKILTIVLLIISNVFMTFAWYGHLQLEKRGLLNSWPLFGIILLSWGIALLEYCFLIPANKMGFEGNGGPFNLFQLKVTAEVISITVFTIIALFIFQGQKLQWNHLAAFLCLIGAVYFTFLPGKS